MNHVSKILLVMTAFVFSSAVHAGLITFNDRTAFESFIGSSTTDDLSTITNGHNTAFSRTDFSYAGSMFGCVSGLSQCGDNSSFGFDYPGYVWMYNTGIFTFNSGITAFGLDLGVRSKQATVFSLNGLTTTVSNSTPAFFGIASDDDSLFTQVTISGVSSGDLFDNVTYSFIPNGGGQQNSGQVPEPSIFALMVLGLAGLGLAVRRKQYS